MEEDDDADDGRVSHSELRWSEKNVFRESKDGVFLNILEARILGFLFLFFVSSN